MKLAPILPMFLAAAVFCRAQNPIVATSAAYFGLGVPANGSIVTLFCLGVSVSQTGAAAAFPLPREIQGVRVMIGGRVAPLFAVAPISANAIQINAQVPMDAEINSGTVSIRVEHGETVLTMNVRVRSESPGEFFRITESEGLFQRANAGYALVKDANPAQAGDTLVTYLTGLAPALPSVHDGEPAPIEPLSRVPEYGDAAGIEEWSVVVSGIVVKPMFVGLAPGLAGVYQVNFTLPSLPARSAEIMLQRRSCRAVFGSCVNGGGNTTISRSAAVRLPTLSPTN